MGGFDLDTGDVVNLLGGVGTLVISLGVAYLVVKIGDAVSK